MTAVTTSSVIVDELATVSNMNSVFNRFICKLDLLSYKNLLWVGTWRKGFSLDDFLCSPSVLD